MTKLYSEKSLNHNNYTRYIKYRHWYGICCYLLKQAITQEVGEEAVHGAGRTEEAEQADGEEAEAAGDFEKASRRSLRQHQLHYSGAYHKTYQQKLPSWYTRKSRELLENVDKRQLHFASYNWLQSRIPAISNWHDE